MGAKVQGSESSLEFDSRERKNFQGAKVPGNELAREQKDHGANWPGSHWPIRSRELFAVVSAQLVTESKKSTGRSIRY